MGPHSSNVSVLFKCVWANGGGNSHGAYNVFINDVRGSHSPLSAEGLNYSSIIFVSYSRDVRLRQ